MEIVQNNYVNKDVECPHCKSILKLGPDDVTFSTNIGEDTCGVNCGWCKYFICPCCKKMVILEEGDYDDDTPSFWNNIKDIWADFKRILDIL